MRTEGSTSSSINVHTSDKRSLADALDACAKSTDIQACKVVVTSVPSQMREILKKANTADNEAAPSITFAEAISALKQLKVNDETRKHGTTLLVRGSSEHDASRGRKSSRLDDIKYRTKCVACGKTGH